MPNEAAAGFWSYARADNQLDGGAILELASLIGEEYNLLTGEPLELFVDRDNITWQQEWRERIGSSLTEITFFIPIITPRYFRTPECRRELLEFAARAMSLGVRELLLPILYVETQDLSPESGDEAVTLVANAQYVDWRAVRLWAPDSRDYRVAVNSLAQRLLDIARNVTETHFNRGPNDTTTGSRRPDHRPVRSGTPGGMSRLSGSNLQYSGSIPQERNVSARDLEFTESRNSEVEIASVSPSSAPGWIFVSSRRDDAAYPSGWLFDKLAQNFGRDQIFKDIDSIQLGDDFVEVITAAVARCDVLLAIIGRRWLTLSDEGGRRRLDNPSDFVRLEIEAAITRNIRIIPILVDGARMPSAEDLPPSLARLARRQALELSPTHFDFDLSRLLRILDRTLSSSRVPPGDSA
jgi:hypothetical protein